MRDETRCIACVEPERNCGERDCVAAARVAVMAPEYPVTFLVREAPMVLGLPVEA